MRLSKPPLCKGMSETLKIQVGDVEFLAKSNLCSSEAELGDLRACRSAAWWGKGFSYAKNEPLLDDEIKKSAARICGGFAFLFNFLLNLRWFSGT